MVADLYFVFDVGAEGRVVVSDGACGDVLFAGSVYDCVQVF